MSSHRPDRVSSYRWWLLAGGAALGLLAVSGRARAESGINNGFLYSNTTPAARSVPSRNPYFLGWSAAVSSTGGLFNYPREPGGVDVDLRGKSVYAATRDGLIVCLAAGGETKWHKDLGGNMLSPPTVFNDLLVAGTSEGVVYTLNKVTGDTVNPRAILGEELITKPVVVESSPGVNRAYVGSSAESIFAIDLETGQKLWRAHRDPPSQFTVYGIARPIVTPKAVFMSFADGVVEARNSENGSLLWEKHISTPGDMLDVDGLAYNGQTLFAASYTGGVFALDPESGAIRWRTQMPEASRLVVDGPYVFAGAPGLWVGMRAADGVIGWRFRFPEGHTSTTAVVSERYLIFAEAEGPLYFVDKRTGEPAGMLSSGEGFSSPPAEAGPVLGVLSNGGRVYTLTVVP